MVARAPHAVPRSPGQCSGMTPERLPRVGLAFTRMGVFSSPPGGEASGTGDPVSWFQIEPGWSVVGSDGELVGSVVSVVGDKQNDIFDGLAVSLGESSPPRYVPGERVGLIFPGKVTVRFAGSEEPQLEEFEAPKPVTVWRPSAPSVGTRLSNWIRGKR
jgi:hypothetical protein